MRRKKEKMQKLFCNYNEQNAIVFIFCSFICVSQQYTTNNTSVNTLVRISHQLVQITEETQSFGNKNFTYYAVSLASIAST